MKNEIDCLVLTRMSRENVIVLMLENVEMKIVRIRDIDSIV